MLSDLASIVKKSNKYSTYYVVAESKRVNGKPRIVKQWYLGTIESIIQMAEGRPDREKPRQIDCEEEGAVSVLYGIAEELGVKEKVNEHVRKRRQGMTVGDYILLTSLNRAIAATSKVKIAEWIDQTTIHLYMPLDRKKLDSQNFWDHFDKIDEDTVEKIGDELARAAVKLENISLDCLVYDTSNYFNFWDVLNPSKLAKLTKSKSGRSSLRHIGLALAVDRDWGLPLFHRLYPANNHDSKVFRNLIDAMFEQIRDTINDKRGVTFVFDKGNGTYPPKTF
jgi:transposase